MDHRKPGLVHKIGVWLVVHRHKWVVRWLAQLGFLDAAGPDDIMFLRFDFWNSKVKKLFRRHHKNTEALRDGTR